MVAPPALAADELDDQALERVVGGLERIFDPVTAAVDVRPAAPPR